MKFQYVHNRRRSGDELDATLAIAVPDKTFLEKMFITHANATLLPSGISVMSQKDQFVKSIGRTLAEKRVVLVKWYLSDVTQDGTTHIYHMYTSNMVVDGKKHHINIALTTVAESEYVRLISAIIEPSYIEQGENHV